MNKQRRKDLDKVLEALRKASDPLTDAQADLESIKDEESEAAESVGEAFPGSERAELLAESVGQLETALEAVESVYDLLDEAITAIEEAQG